MDARLCFLGLLGFLFLFGCSTQKLQMVAPVPKQILTQNSEIQTFIEEMVRRHQFSERDLKEMFRKVSIQPKVLELIARPFEAKPWHQYRQRFINQERIEKGLRFWNEHAALLLRAEQAFEIPQEILIGILGVETVYGENTGEYNVLEALTTLAFYYPPRAKFFRGELESFLLFMREQGLSPEDIKGSYAGAMGKPQFIPSSIRNYAIDFDKDGIIDLTRSTADAIGSIAHYFSKHHWRSLEWIAAPVQNGSPQAESLLQIKLERPTNTIAELRKMGVKVSGNIPQDNKAFVFALETSTGPEYWVGSENLYAITRYNHSLHYAMAVLELGEEIVALNRLAKK